LGGGMSAGRIAGLIVRWRGQWMTAECATVSDKSILYST